jgi:hypothetical protein
MNKEQVTSRIRKYWFWSVLVLGLIIITFTFQDYGITWDETPQSIYGELVLKYFKSGFTDKECNSFFDAKYFGPLFELIAAIVYQYNETYKFEIRHFCIALTALLSLAGLMKYSNLFRDPKVMVFSTFALIMLSRFYGHSFNNSKDIPFACGFVWAMFAIALLFHEDKLSWRRTVFASTAIGFTLSIRAGGFLLFFYLLIIVCVYWMLHQKFSKNILQKVFLFKTPIIWHGIIIITIAWVIMISVWPWAHVSPILNPIQALKTLSAFHTKYPVLYEGKTIFSNQLPWHYLPKYLLITTPPLLLLFFIIGLAQSIIEQKRNHKSKESLLYFITQLWFFFPILFYIIKLPNVYDGIRHFLFILPAMAIFAGIGASAFLNLFPTLYRKIAFVLLGIFIIFLTTLNHVTLHPYQMTYFNVFTGGVQKAWKKYETDYWVSSYKEAMEWVNQHSDLEKKPTTVLLAANNYSRKAAEHYRSPQIKIYTIFKQIPQVILPSEIDYYISTTRYGLHKNFPKTPVVHTIGRNGGVFTVIKTNIK